MACGGGGPPAAGFGVDTPAAGGRDCVACGGRQLIAKPLDGMRRDDDANCREHSRKRRIAHAGQFAFERLPCWLIKRRDPMKYKIALRQSEEGFSVSVPGLPGCWSQGATEQEALQNIQDAIKEYLATVEDLLEGATVREIEVPA